MDSGLILYKEGGNLKIKVIPEDFIVKELVNIKYAAGGRYRIYLLEKRHWNTMDALKFISRENKVPLSKIGSGGRKDRHALTYQYISVPREYELQFERPNVRLQFVGFAGDFVSPAVLEGNYFEITLRRIEPGRVDEIRSRLSEVEAFGYPNFFDDQRFGSVEDPEEFIAERIIKKHYNGALKLYFTTIHPEDKREEKERKRKIAGLWGRWEEILPLCRTPVEKDIVKILQEGQSKKHLAAALNAIPKEELSMFFSAYQSFLWNKTLEKLLPLFAGELFTVKGKIMDYTFYRALPPGKLKALRKLEIPTVSSRIPDAAPEVKKALEEVLAERGVKPSDFNLKKIRKSFFKSFMRPAIVFPQGLYSSPFEVDDLYPGYRKVKIKFTLPPGSFATMMIKSLGI
ncbi:tRNA pseudouridine(13) synthase TruD [Thermosediminibacter litoriperuensis]|nr:tRNA pseudouridine(13) synthase TruD [Thermosediminibacter litoriperuensis]